MPRNAEGPALTVRRAATTPSTGASRASTVTTVTLTVLVTAPTTTPTIITTASTRVTGSPARVILGGFLAAGITKTRGILARRIIHLQTKLTATIIIDIHTISRFTTAAIRIRTTIAATSSVLKRCLLSSCTSMGRQCVRTTKTNFVGIVIIICMSFVAAAKQMTVHEA